MRIKGIRIKRPALIGCVVFLVRIDFYDGNPSGAIKISSTSRRNGPNIAIAQSLPIAVPIFNQRIEDDDYEEVK